MGLEGRKGHGVSGVVASVYEVSFEVMKKISRLILKSVTILKNPCTLYG